MFLLFILYYYKNQELVKMLNCLSGKKFLGKVLAIICSIAILLPNAAYAATVTTWTDLVSDIAVTGASNTTTLTDYIEAPSDSCWL